MFKNWKIRTRMIVSYGIIVLLAAIIALLSLSGLKKSNEDLENFIAHPYKADAAVKMCRIETNIAARTIREMLIDDNVNNYPKYKDKVDESIASVQENVKIFSESYEANDGLKEKYETALNKWTDIGYQIIDEIEKGNDDQAGKMLLEQCSPALEELIGVAKEIDVKTVAMQNDSLAKNARNLNLTSIVIIVLMLVALIFSAVVASVVTKSIVQPVEEVEYAAKQLSKGILNTKINYISKDEIGIMAESMRASMKTLSVYIHDIDTALSTMEKGDFNIGVSEPFVGEFVNIEQSFMKFSTIISETLGQINQVADQVAGGSEQVSDGSQALASGATQQAASVEELSAAISVITEQIQTNAQNAQMANSLSDEAGAGVKESNQHMEDMVSAMNEISNTSNAIGKIIKTIDDIAFQTNILALNAAVEAARAGEAGKGFAVVADEVRNLAHKSADAANSTTELIESTISAIENGTKIADETAQSLEIVVEKAGAVGQRITEIAQASDEQATSIQQVSTGVEQISSVIQTNSATAQESAAASEELSGHAQVLKELVDKFILRRE